MRWPMDIIWMGLVGMLGILTALVLAWGRRDTKKILQEQQRLLQQMEAGQQQAHEPATRMLGESGGEERVHDRHRD
jgi:hypothetical protein